jgi:hypothetical protein
MKLLNFAINVTALSSSIAQAELPREFHQILGAGSGIRQELASQDSDGVVQVADGLRFDTLYSDIQVLELVVDNRGYDKQVYVYDRNRTYEFERAVTIRFVRDRRDFDSRDGAAMYLGKTADGRDRFAVSLVSSFRASPAAPVDIYVKMARSQFQTTSVRFDR